VFFFERVWVSNECTRGIALRAGVVRKTQKPQQDILFGGLAHKRSHILRREVHSPVVQTMKLLSLTISSFVSRT
jgi:hypothetical protein